MLKLPNVTLCAVSSIKQEETQCALNISQEGIQYGDVVFIQNQHITSSDTYSHFVLYDLYKYIHTPHVLLIQYDGHILNPSKWQDEFLEYDYIGAPWIPNTHFTPEGEEVRVGNGGFSLRSKKLLEAPTKLNLPFTDGGKGFFHEDGNLCNYHRKTLEEYGIKFAPVELAAQFSREQKVPESVHDTFGFHKYKHW